MDYLHFLVIYTLIVYFTHENTQLNNNVLYIQKNNTITYQNYTDSPFVLSHLPTKNDIFISS